MVLLAVRELVNITKPAIENSAPRLVDIFRVSIVLYCGDMDELIVPFVIVRLEIPFHQRTL